MNAWDSEGRVLLLRGDGALARGNQEAALLAFQTLVEGFPERPEGYNKMGVVYAGLGDVERAERWFLASLARDRRHAPALSNLGNIYLERGDVDNAISHYTLALKADPNYSPAHHNLAAAYRRKGDIAGSVTHLKRSRALGERSLSGEGGRARRHPLAGGARWMVWPLLAAAVALLVVRPR